MPTTLYHFFTSFSSVAISDADDNDDNNIEDDEELSADLAIRTHIPHSLLNNTSPVQDLLMHIFRVFYFLNSL